MRTDGRAGRIPLSAMVFSSVAALLLAACPAGLPDPDDGGRTPSAPANAAPTASGADAALGLYRQGNLEAAEAALRAALQEAPGDGRLLEALGMVYARTDRPRQAEETLRSAVALEPASPGGWMALAGVFAETGRYEEALDAVRSVRRLDPRYAVAAIEEARMLSRLGRNDDAEAAARSAIAADANSAEARYLLAGCLRRRGAFDDAARALQEAIALDPDHVGALSQLATLEMRRGRRDAAERYREAHRQALARLRVEDRVRGNRLAGAAAFNRGDYETALHEFELIARETPDDPQVYLHLGSTQMALGHHDEARSALERSLEIDPSDERALTELGRLHALDNRFEAAFAVLRRAIAANPDYPEPHYILAGLHMAQGEAGLYRRELRRFEELRALHGEDGAARPGPGEQP